MISEFKPPRKILSSSGERYGDGYATLTLTRRYGDDDAVKLLLKLYAISFNWPQKVFIFVSIKIDQAL